MLYVPPKTSVSSWRILKNLSINYPKSLLNAHTHQQHASITIYITTNAPAFRVGETLRSIIGKLSVSSDLARTHTHTHISIDQTRVNRHFSVTEWCDECDVANNEINYRRARVRLRGCFGFTGPRELCGRIAHMYSGKMLDARLWWLTGHATHLYAHVMSRCETQSRLYGLFCCPCAEFHCIADIC